MGIRLLPKSEIDKAKSLDRQREIEEGKKLANRVDNLRRLHSKEEADLSQFRVKTLANIQVEINSEIERLERIKKEIAEKRQELSTLSGPLDRAWMLYLNTEKKAIDALKKESESKLTAAERLLLESDKKAIDSQTSMSQKLQELQEKREEWEQYVLIEKKNIEKSKSDTEKSEQETNRKLVEARKIVQANKKEQEQFAVLRLQYTEDLTHSKNLVEAGKKTLLDAEQQAIAIKKSSEKIEKELQRRTNELKEREISLKLYEERIVAKEKEVEDRELAALAKELLYYSPVKKKEHGT